MAQKRRKEGGKKFDSEKNRLDLIPSEAIEEIGKVFSYGCSKYGESNWANGIRFSRLIGAAKRHLNSFESGDEDLDPETGLVHIAHAATNLVFLLWMIKNRPDMDDRWQLKFKKRRK